MASADSQRPIPTPLDVSSTWQAGGPPRVMRVTFMLMPVGSTPCLSVQVSGFEDIGLLTQHDRLVCDSCSSGQCLACGFLQIPPRGGHPCRSANRSPCRAGRGLSPPSRPGRPPQRAGTAPAKALRAMPGAPKKGPQQRAAKSVTRIEYRFKYRYRLEPVSESRGLALVGQACSAATAYNSDSSA